MRKGAQVKKLYDENGSALGFVVILILSMTLLASATMTLAKGQLTVSSLGRQTSNSYHLARSGAEKTIDTMNKEIAMELPKLMEEANVEVHKKLLAEDVDGITYQYRGDLYLGEYVGRENENQYKIELKKCIYNYIVGKFINSNKADSSYKAFSDTKDNMPIQITTRLYSNHSTATQRVPEDIASIVRGLATENNIGVKPDDKDVFVIEVIASVKEATNKTLVTSRVVGTIGLERLLENDQLLEEYEWAKNNGSRTGYSEALQAAVILFGEPDSIGSFNDLIKLSVFDTNSDWSYNNPIYITSVSQEIEPFGFGEIPTAIVCREQDTTIILKGPGVFNGIIITPGKVEIATDIVINGTIIVGNEYIEADNIAINYDPDMLLKIRFMDKSLQRKLYDSLRITNYEAVSSVIGEGSIKEQEKIDVIMGKKDKRIIQLSPKSIISSEESGLKFVMRSLRKL